LLISVAFSSVDQKLLVVLENHLQSVSSSLCSSLVDLSVRISMVEMILEAFQHQHLQSQYLAQLFLLSYCIKQQLVLTVVPVWIDTYSHFSHCLPLACLFPIPLVCSSASICSVFPSFGGRPSVILSDILTVALV
jgi:hypothetical protein